MEYHIKDQQKVKCGWIRMNEFSFYFLTFFELEQHIEILIQYDSTIYDQIPDNIVSFWYTPVLGYTHLDEVPTSEPADSG